MIKCNHHLTCQPCSHVTSLVTPPSLCPQNLIVSMVTTGDVTCEQTPKHRLTRRSAVLRLAFRYGREPWVRASRRAGGTFSHTWNIASFFEWFQCNHIQGAFMSCEAAKDPKNRDQVVSMREASSELIICESNIVDRSICGTITTIFLIPTPRYIFILLLSLLNAYIWKKRCVHTEQNRKPFLVEIGIFRTKSASNWSEQHMAELYRWMWSLLTRKVCVGLWQVGLSGVRVGSWALRYRWHPSSQTDCLWEVGSVNVSNWPATDQFSCIVNLILIILRTCAQF